MGHGDQSTLSDFKMIFNLLKNKHLSKSSVEIEKIVCGFSHSACLCASKVFVWGIAGSHETQIFKIPTLLEYCVDSNKNRVEFKDIIDVKLGEMLSLFLNTKVIFYENTNSFLKKGEVYGFGENTDNQLGMMKENIYNNYPQKIEGLKETIGHVNFFFSILNKNS